MKPPIPESELAELLALARLPTKSMPDPSRVPMFRAVANLKGQITAEKKFPSNYWPPANGTAWQEIRDALDQAMIDRDFDAFEAFVEAWQKTGGASEVIRVKITMGTGETMQGSAYGSHDGCHRRPVSEAVLDAIIQIQRREKRAPISSEIMSEVSRHLPSAIDDTELSKQLRFLGLQDRVNRRDELVS